MAAGGGREEEGGGGVDGVVVDEWEGGSDGEGVENEGVCRGAPVKQFD